MKYISKLVDIMNTEETDSIRYQLAEQLYNGYHEFMVTRCDDPVGKLLEQTVDVMTDRRTPIKYLTKVSPEDQRTVLTEAKKALRKIRNREMTEDEYNNLLNETDWITKARTMVNNANMYGNPFSGREKLAEKAKQPTNPVEETPRILFGDYTKHSEEMQKLSQKLNGGLAA